MRLLLFADSDGCLCEIYRRFFAARGYDVWTATGGVDCLAMLRRRPPDVLILDRHLLWGGAEGVLAYLREDAGPAPAVLMTGEPLTSPRTGSQPPPVVAAFGKPFRLAELLAAIRATDRPDTGRPREHCALVNRS